MLHQKASVLFLNYFAFDELFRDVILVRGPTKLLRFALAPCPTLCQRRSVQTTLTNISHRACLKDKYEQASTQIFDYAYHSRASAWKLFLAGTRYSFVNFIRKNEGHRIRKNAYTSSARILSMTADAFDLFCLTSFVHFKNFLISRSKEIIRRNVQCRPT